MFYRIKWTIEWKSQNFKNSLRSGLSVSSRVVDVCQNIPAETLNQNYKWATEIMHKHSLQIVWDVLWVETIVWSEETIAYAGSEWWVDSTRRQFWNFSAINPPWYVQMSCSFHRWLSQHQRQICVGFSEVYVYRLKQTILLSTLVEIALAKRLPVHLRKKLWLKFT